MGRFKLTAVRPRQNISGKPFKGILAIEHWIGLQDDEVADLIDRGYVPQMSGATTAYGNQVAESPVYFPRALVVSTDQTINQGDMVWWDGVNYTLKPLTSSSQVEVGTTGGFCGVAAVGNVPNVYPNPQAGAPSENLPGIVVQMGGTAWLALQANDVIDYHFQDVTQAGDAQTVTRGAATSSNRVGKVVIPAPAVPRGAPGATPVSESVAGGTRVRVWIERKFPTTALL